LTQGTPEVNFQRDSHDTVASLAMGVATVSELPGAGVDTEEDLARANARWTELSAPGT